MHAAPPPRRARILVVDDHAAARESVLDVLRCVGHNADGVASAVEALPRLEREPYDVVITDLQMPGMDGLELIRQLHRRRLSAQCIMITAHATIASAVEAMRHGAFDYLEKPFDAQRLERLVDRALECRRLREPLGSDAPPAAVGPPATGLLGMIGASRGLHTLRERILQVGPTDETVLICGESGTGKELVARALHAASRRATRPLVSLNCPALSPQLAESELFGHRRGAFTGADADRAGRFQAAEGGTILLDEITEIDLPLQAKLLRVLQQRTYEPVGSSESRVADVRVIASTNRDLLAEVAAGRFREDLYYRLAVVPLTLPPLRERRDDVELLVAHFLAQACRRLQRAPLAVAADARRLLAAYHWPGNVRELENLITRACVLCAADVLTAGDLEPWLQLAPTPTAPPRDEAQRGAPDLVGAPLAEVEREMILATLAQFDGHRAKAAAALGIGVRTLSGKLRAYGVAPRARSLDAPPNAPHRQMLPLGSADSADPPWRAAA
jgi:DNA-binding NtrC family response regulator